MRAMARWGNAVLLVAMGAVLVFKILSMLVPSLGKHDQLASRLMIAMVALNGLVFGWHDWEKWYGKVIAAVGTAMLLAFFLPQIPGRLYIMGAGTVAILIYLFTAFGKK